MPLPLVTMQTILNAFQNPRHLAASKIPSYINSACSSPAPHEEVTFYFPLGAERCEDP